MPARDAREGQTDYPALPGQHADYIQRLQERQADLGLEVTVNRGRTYPGGGAQDPEAADRVETGLKVDEIVGDQGQAYKVTVNRTGRPAGAPAPSGGYAPMYVDQPAQRGAEPIVHDPMTPEQRKAATRAAAQMYADRRIAADEAAEGQERPGVVMVDHPRQPAHHVPGEVVYADRVVGAPLVVDSDAALQAEREEEEVAAVVRRDAAAVRADQEKLLAAQPESTDDATVDEYGRTVSTSVYADRAAKARQAKADKAKASKAAAKPAADEDDDA